MDYFNWWPRTPPGLLTEIMLALVGAVCLVVWRAKKLWDFHNVDTHGTLLLQMEVNGVLLAHIGMLTAEERGGKSKHIWPMSQINDDDFPYTQMTDLTFTHIIVKQKRTEKNLVTISVLDRENQFWHADFYWIKDATIGNRPGFPGKLLLPHNLVLRYLDSTAEE